ncbi:MAG: hypothetical protein U0232_10395 [Thermomicrobiales bacterium]
MGVRGVAHQFDLVDELVQRVVLGGDGVDDQEPPAGAQDALDFVDRAGEVGEVVGGEAAGGEID